MEVTKKWVKSTHFFFTVYLLRKLVNTIKECYFLTASSEVTLHGSLSPVLITIVACITWKSIIYASNIIFSGVCSQHLIGY